MTKFGSVMTGQDRTGVCVCVCVGGWVDGCLGRRWLGIGLGHRSLYKLSYS